MSAEEEDDEVVMKMKIETMNINGGITAIEEEMIKLSQFVPSLMWGFGMWKVLVLSKGNYVICTLITLDASLIFLCLDACVSLLLLFINNTINSFLI